MLSREPLSSLIAYSQLLDVFSSFLFTIATVQRDTQMGLSSSMVESYLSVLHAHAARRYRGSGVRNT
jgi:hypothetical protein